MICRQAFRSPLSAESQNRLEEIDDEALTLHSGYHIKEGTRNDEASAKKKMKLLGSEWWMEDL